VARCIAVVKPVDKKSSQDDDASSTSSDYEDPDERPSRKSHQRAPPSTAADDDGDDYDLYDDVTNGPPCPPTTNPTVHDPDEDDLIYERCDEIVAPAPSGVAPADDYCNMYYGRWNNVAGDDRELSFRQGDLLTVVSRQYDEFGWWVASLDGTVGLVPSEYLTPAYQRVDT